MSMRKVLLFSAVSVLSMLPFAEAVSYGYVDCDDYTYVFGHSEVSGGITPAGIKWAFSSVDEGIWMPLTWLSYMLDGEFGGSASVRHAHSIALHGLNAGLVFLMLLALMPALGGKTGRTNVAIALFCALLWGVHPLRCESAVWIASRKDVLSLFWMLVAALLWLSGGKKAWWASLASFTLSAMAKPSVMTLPLLLGILDVFIRRNVRWQRLVWYAPVAVATGVLAAIAQRAGGATVELANTSLIWRLLNAVAACGIYIWHTVWPVNLAVQCMARYPEMPKFLVPGLALCAALGAFLWVRCRRAVLAWRLTADPDGITAGLLWFFVAVGPMLGIAGFGYHAFADRFTYIPAIGLSIAVFAVCLKARAAGRNLVIAALAALCVAFGARAAVQTRYWRDDLSMWRRTIEVDGPRNTVAQLGVAVWHFEHDHDIDASIKAFDIVCKYRPQLLETCFDRYMMALCEAGNIVQANALMPNLVALNYKVIIREGEKARARGDVLNVRETERFILARAAWLIAQKMYRAADGELSRIASNEPNSRPMLYLKGRLAEAQGDRKERDKCWRQLLEHGTGDEIARYRFVADLIRQ